MSWLKGTIEEFKGGKPQHRDLRVIRTDGGQEWKDLHFFHLSLGRNAGYAEEDLAAGQSIEFEPELQSDRPKVKRFKPREGRPEPRPEAAPASSFLNPYHFIPLLAPPPTTLRDAGEVLGSETYHDRFGSGPNGARRYSGRVVCRLETEGPLVIGAEQRPLDGDPEKEREILPFGLPDPGAPQEPYGRTPMIPGSALRGLISSLVEASTNSTMRVLGDETFTRRAELGGESLSALGQVVEEDGVLRLRPLTLSVKEMSREGEKASRERCRVLLNAYTFDRSANRVRPVEPSFLGRRKPASSSRSRSEPWYLQLPALRWHWKGQFLLGLMSDEGPIPEAEWQQLEPARRERYTRGLLYVLGLDEPGKAANLPPTKKHELFLPFPEGIEKRPLLEISRQALEEFKALARASSEIDRGGGGGEYPFLPAGREREPGGVEVRARDLVYYEAQGDQVTRLAFSSAWRRPVPGSLSESLEKVSPHLVPLSAKREQLTFAERLFGFVEDQGKRALAGRLRFAHALVESERPAGGWYGAPVTLQILAAPKPPSPALYFGNNGYRSKRDLDLQRHSPQGRKVYLHHRREDVEAGRYASRDSEKRKLQARVRPLPSGTRFLFHVEFENLEAEELGSLLYALRPQASFRHKLGMGRPLGLGTVRIVPLALAWRDREEGYEAEALFARKYRWIESSVEASAWHALPPELALRYRHEAEAAGTEEAVPPAGLPTLEGLRSAFAAQIAPEVRHALELVGDPEKVHLPVTYPLIEEQEKEGEHFQWFVRNDKEATYRKALEPIGLRETLPSLRRYPKPPQKPRR